MIEGEVVEVAVDDVGTMVVGGEVVVVGAVEGDVVDGSNVVVWLDVVAETPARVVDPPAAPPHAATSIASAQTIGRRSMDTPYSPRIIRLPIGNRKGRMPQRSVAPQRRHVAPLLHAGLDVGHPCHNASAGSLFIGVSVRVRSVYFIGPRRNGEVEHQHRRVRPGEAQPSSNHWDLWLSQTC